MDQVKETLNGIVSALVENPADVRIAESHDDRGVLLTLDVNRADMGRVIGRSGETAKAIRTLLRAIGMRHQARVSLKINEPAE